MEEQCEEVKSGPVKENVQNDQRVLDQSRTLRCSGPDLKQSDQSGVKVQSEWVRSDILQMKFRELIFSDPVFRVEKSDS
ncbi:hypothetical protein MHYP_G00089940 [Metynnis hypsauchen]